MKWVVVGLGNPGGEYAKTRHNAGRIVVDQLREERGFSEWEYKKTYDGLVSKGEIAGKNVLLLLPETFMNESGRSLAKLVKSSKQAEQLIVVHDDADLPLGSWRFSYDRGAGGQKGVASIIATLKTRAFIRVRVGIAPEQAEGEVHMKAGDFVLGKFRANEITVIEKRSEQIALSIEQLMTEGLELSRSKWKKWGPND